MLPACVSLIVQDSINNNSLGKKESWKTSPTTTGMKKLLSIGEGSGDLCVTPRNPEPRPVLECS